MLPPLDPAVLEDNPRFKILYKDITEKKLHTSDGSTIDPGQDARWAAAWKTITTSRTRSAHLHLLRSALLALAHRYPPAPPTTAGTSLGSASECSLQEELQTVLSILFTPTDISNISIPESELLRADTEYYMQNLTTVVSALTAYLDRTTPHIATILHQQSPADLGITNEKGKESTSKPAQGQNPLNLSVASSSPGLSRSSSRSPHPYSAPDPTKVASLLAKPPKSFLTLGTPHTYDSSSTFPILPSAPVELRAAHAELVVETARILEEATHGTVAHHDRARVELLALQAQLLRSKMKLREAEGFTAEVVVEKSASEKNTSSPDEYSGEFGNRSARKTGPLTRLGKLLSEYAEKRETNLSQS